MKITKIIKWGSIILLSSVVLVWADCQAERWRLFHERVIDCLDMGNPLAVALCQGGATLAHGNLQSALLRHEWKRINN